MKYISTKSASEILLSMIALFVASGFNPISIQGATIPTITVPQKTIVVYNVDIGFKTSAMSSVDVIDEPTYKRIGIVLGDSLLLKAVLTPDITLPSGKFSWSGIQSGNGQTISPNITHVGLNSESVSVGGKTKTALITALAVDSPNEYYWTATHPIAAAAIFVSLAPAAEAWAASANTINNWGDSYLHNGRADAARHAYWNVLMSFSSLVGPSLAQEAGLAHEKTNLEDNGPHNETVMDLINNQGGLNIAAGLPLDASEIIQQSAVVGAVNAGNLVILDDMSNSPPAGLLQPSNL